MQKIKNFSFVIIIVSILLHLDGCGEPVSKKNVEVVIEDGGEFPQSLAGKWKVVKSSKWKVGENSWEIVLEPDGMISSAVVSPGHVRITPGKPKTILRDNNKKSVYEPGIWTVQYSPQSRELTVEINMDHIQLNLGKVILDGKTTDIFTGQVSEDGKTWETEWFSFPEYIATTQKRGDITFAPTNSIGAILTFQKIED